LCPEQIESRKKQDFHKTVTSRKFDFRFPFFRLKVVKKDYTFEGCCQIPFMSVVSVFRSQKVTMGGETKVIMSTKKSDVATQL